MSEVDNIDISYSSVIDNIEISHSGNIDSIDIDYINDIKNIEISFAEGVQSIYSVNNLLGDVKLSASGILSTVTPSEGVYSYSFSHNLSSDVPMVSLYNTDNKLVFGDVQILDSNSVTIKSVINLLGYKVVVQI